MFTLSVTMGSALDVVLAVDAGTSALDVEWALHSYLRVGDVREVRLSGLDGADYVDKVAEGVRTRQDGPVALVEETDRVYARATPVSLHDPGLGRTVLATGVGNTQTVVWNPFGDKAAGMADLGDAWPPTAARPITSVAPRSASASASSDLDDARPRAGELAGGRSRARGDEVGEERLRGLP